VWDHVVSSKVLEWLKGQGDSWLVYEMREVGRAAMLLVLSSAVLLIVALRRRKARRIGLAARLLFVVCLVLDVGLVARGIT
jgi:hypothetical protein